MAELSTRSQRLMIAGGGTGGHIYPAIAIAQEWVARRGADRDVIFVGTEYGLEKTIVPKAGFPLEFINVGGLKGKSAGQTLRNLFRLPLGVIDAWRVISRHRPAVILGVGGYSSGPVLILGALRRIPTIVHESNAFPGVTNRILARFVTTVAAGFAPALTRMKRTDGVVTGNPVRRDFFDAVSSKTGGAFRLLVFGGSQGSRIINTAVTEALLFLAHLKDRIEIVHQTGPTELERVQAAYRSSAFSSARVVPYLDPIAGEIASADLVVCRAGAMTVGELAAMGRPAILIPFAAATNNHQEMNAREVEAAGGAVVITEKELSGERLAAAISELAGDPKRSLAMGVSARKLAQPDATLRIVEMIEKLAKY